MSARETTGSRTIQMSSTDKLVKSKQRVADHGEVFTPAWMVEDMLNLIKDETERIDARVLEPSFMCNSDVSRDIRFAA